MVKFIHTADWQIGMKAAHVGAVGETVRSERLVSAKRVVDLAKEHGADFIVVAGDTFEDNAVDRVLVQKVADILASFSKPVLIISGNHDPLVPGSVWEHPAWNSHTNVHVFQEAKALELENATIYPSPLFEKHSLSNPIDWIDATSNTKISIGIGHGTVLGASHGAVDFPIDRDAPESCGLDYLALGHLHSFATYPTTDGTVRVAYSGTHETTKFGERDSGNATLVEIDSRGSIPVLKSIRTGSLTWSTLDETVTGEGDISRIRERIEALGEIESSLIELKLGGVLHHADQSELTRIRELLQARFLYGRIDDSNLLPCPTDEIWLNQLPSGLMQTVARQLQHWTAPTNLNRSLSNEVDLNETSATLNERPAIASPEIATRSLLELYRLMQDETS